MTKRRRTSPSRAGSGAQLGPGVWTRLRYVVFDAEGERVSAAEEEMGFVFGYGALLPALEVALAGLGAGARRSVVLPPEEAYGARDPRAELELDRDEFPADVAEGQRYDVERDDGTPLVLRVLGVTETSVVVDLNHPLAGQRVRFEIEVLEARPASAEELSLAEAALLEEPGDEAEPAPGGAADGDGDGVEGAVGADSALLPAASLLRRGVRS